MKVSESQLRLLVRSLLRESAGSSLLPPGVDHDFFVAWYRRCGSNRITVNVPNVTKRLVGVGVSPEGAAELAKLAADCLDPSYPVPTTTKKTAASTISRGIRPGLSALNLIKKTIERENFGTRTAWAFVSCFMSEEASREAPSNPVAAGWMPAARDEDILYKVAKEAAVDHFPKIRREDIEREMNFVESVSAFEEVKEVPVRNLRRLLVQGIDGIMQAAELYRSL